MKKTICTAILLLITANVNALSFSVEEDGTGKSSLYCFKTGEDGTGNKTGEDGTGNKTGEDGTGNKTGEDGTGNKTICQIINIEERESFFNFEFNRY